MVPSRTRRTPRNSRNLRSQHRRLLPCYSEVNSAVVWDASIFFAISLYEAKANVIHANKWRTAEYRCAVTHAARSRPDGAALAERIIDHPLVIKPQRGFVTGCARASRERANGAVLQFSGLSIRVALSRTRNDRGIAGRSATIHELDKLPLLGRWHRVAVRAAQETVQVIAGRSIARQTSAIDIPGERSASVRCTRATRTSSITTMLLMTMVKRPTRLRVCDYGCNVRNVRATDCFR